MRIKSIQIENYKCFDRTEMIELHPHMNILVGKNNSGKSAFLEALQHNVFGIPHRSIHSRPNADTPENEITTRRVVIEASGNEVRHLLLEQNEFLIPCPNGIQENGAAYEAELQALLLKSLRFAISPQSGPNGPLNWTAESIPAWGEYKAVPPDQNAHYKFARFISTNNRRELRYRDLVLSGRDRDYSAQLAPIFLNRVYRFGAERFNLGTSSFGVQSELRSDAANLAEVLNALQANIGHRERFNLLVSRVLPDVGAVTTTPSAGNKLQILVWNHGAPLDRKDLAVPLDQSGTGLSQVLAILYVLVTAPFARTICIDEPNSFLHPEAARRLMTIFLEYPQHQFIVSTHSPETMAAATTGNAYLFKWQDGASSITAYSPSDLDASRTALHELGVRLKDVFGYERVLWVEGTTEELCMPLFLRRLGDSGLDTTVLAVADPNSFQRQNPTEIWRIYENLSHAHALLPVTVGFVLDRDGRSDAEIADLMRRSDGKIQFLDRRMFENYLLNPTAIAAVIKEFLPDWAGTPQSVTESLGKNAEDAVFFRPCKPKPWNTPAWLTHVDGASLLSAIFSDLTESKLEFRKTKHTPRITQRILEQDETAFDEISNIVQKLFAAK